MNLIKCAFEKLNTCSGEDIIVVSRIASRTRVLERRKTRRSGGSTPTTLNMKINLSFTYTTFFFISFIKGHKSRKSYIIKKNFNTLLNEFPV